ncbi:hypothetical protein K474DRAFT_1772044 [Panus rudis PR-1116 ss-1]|nr:hypothetical protein K474DRAFT_1772044 [Panus rudis PR-1116 ss-1]
MTLDSDAPLRGQRPRSAITTLRGCVVHPPIPNFSGYWLVICSPFWLRKCSDMATTGGGVSHPTSEESKPHIPTIPTIIRDLPNLSEDSIPLDSPEVSNDPLRNSSLHNGSLREPILLSHLSGHGTLQPHPRSKRSLDFSTTTEDVAIPPYDHRSRPDPGLSSFVLSTGSPAHYHPKVLKLRRNDTSLFPARLSKQVFGQSLYQIIIFLVLHFFRGHRMFSLPPSTGCKSHAQQELLEAQPSGFIALMAVLRLIPDFLVEQLLIRLGVYPIPNLLPTVRLQTGWNASLSTMPNSLRFVTWARSSRTMGHIPAREPFHAYRPYYMEMPGGGIVGSSEIHIDPPGPCGVAVRTLVMVPTVVASVVGAGFPPPPPLEDRAHTILTSPARYFPTDTTLYLLERGIQVHRDTKPNDLGRLRRGMLP